jgi:hypothetical protein
MEQRETEWLYIAVQSYEVQYGPTKVGWTGRSDLFRRIGEHARHHKRIELVVGFGLPRPIGWGIEREVHRHLRRYRSVTPVGETEWYSLPANECVIAVGRQIVNVLGEADADQMCIVRRGPGWDRILETSTR